MLITISIAQEFSKKPLITLPGINSNFDYHDGYICFQNKSDSIYTIYIRQLSPFSNGYIEIISDSTPQINPTISINQNTIYVAWQSWENDHWEIRLQSVSNDTLISASKIKYSDFKDNINPSLSRSTLAWICDEKLLLMFLSDTLFSIEVFDSVGCQNPDNWKNTINVHSIMYEKMMADESKILNLQKLGFNSDWVIDTLVNNGINLNPRNIGFMLSYETFLDGVWKSIVHNTWISANTSFNIKRPSYISFECVTCDIPPQNVLHTFVTYESDSIINNKEVWLEFLPSPLNTKINLSAMEGDDMNPLCVALNDTAVVFWEHETITGSEIWWSKSHIDISTTLNPIKQRFPKDHRLNQNYPNPFNPITRIEFELSKNEKVELSVFDIHGKLISKLLNEQKSSGKHSVVFDAANLAAGLYFYQLKTVTFIKNKKMLLIK